MKPGIVYSAASGLIEKEYRSTRGAGECFALLTSNTYAEPINVSEIWLDGDAAPITLEGCDTLIFIREGSATLHIDSEKYDLTEKTAALVKSGSTFNWLSGKGLKAVEISIPDKTFPYSRKNTVEASNYTPVVKQGAMPTGDATGNRQFEVLYSAANGSGSATMFVGFIPTSGAPDHYHLYDEVCHIVQGGGELHVGDTVQKIEAGSTFVVSPRLLHSIRNNREEDLWILGTFSGGSSFPMGTLPLKGHRRPSVSQRRWISAGLCRRTI